jgi:hypothetical protein
MCGQSHTWLQDVIGPAVGMTQRSRRTESFQVQQGSACHSFFIVFSTFSSFPSSFSFFDPLNLVHTFGNLPQPAQWFIAILLAALCLVPLGACLILPILDLRWLPLSFLALPLIAPLESLFLTPLYGLLGRFQYYSPLLLATRHSDGGLDLHAGTLFDYVMRLRWSDRGPRAVRIVTVDLLRGLLALCHETERGSLPRDARIVASSYFFNDRSLARFGFELNRPPAASVLNLFLASLSIAIRLSFTRGFPAFPNLRKTRQGITSAERLMQHEEEIRRLLQRLSESSRAGACIVLDEPQSKFRSKSRK